MISEAEGSDPATAVGPLRSVEAPETEPREVPVGAAPAVGLVSNPTTFQPGISVSLDGWEIVMVNRETGEMITLDRRSARLARMRKRLSRWGDVAAEMVASGRAEMKQVTNTYRPGRGWRKGDVSGYLKQVRRSLGHRLYGVLWVAELQADRPSREAVHYLLYLLVAPGSFVPTPDKSGMWPHGMSKIESNRRGIGYAMKYAQKVEQKGGDFPKGLRLFSVTFYAWAPVDPHRRRWFRLSAIPAYAEMGFTAAGLPDSPMPSRMEGGGYRWRDEVVRCPWAAIVRRSSVRIL